MANRNLFICIFCAAAVLLSGNFIRATELMTSATQLGPGRVHAEVYYKRMARQDSTITLGGGGAVNVKSSTISSRSSGTDLEMEGSGNGMFTKITYQPFESGLQYYVVTGMSDYNLQIPSGTFSNSYTTGDPGIVVGGGLKYTLVPHTVVTPALSIDISAVHSRYKLTKFASGDGNVVGDTGFLLTELEIQGALTISKKFVFDLGDNKASLDPYGGIKCIRLRTGMEDLSSGSYFSGTRTSYAPFLGVKFKPFPYEGIVVEGSFINELSASVGLTVGF